MSQPTSAEIVKMWSEYATACGQSGCSILTLDAFREKVLGWDKPAVEPPKPQPRTPDEAVAEMKRRNPELFPETKAKTKTL